MFLTLIFSINKNLLQASWVLAGQFWQTPPELKGTSFAPFHMKCKVIVNAK
jgi:hypothetical protein